MMATKRFLLALMIMVGLASGRSEAGLILGNLPGQNGSGATSIELTFAVEFQTGPTDQTLGSATFEIRQSPGGTVTGGLRAFDPTHPDTPGALLDAFVSPPLVDTPPQAATFTPSQPFTLLANTKYWFALTASPSDFGYTFGSTPLGPGATYLGDYFDNPFFTANSGIPAFELNTLIVPEPSSMVLLGIAGGVGLGFVGWRGRRCFHS